MRLVSSALLPLRCIVVSLAGLNLLACGGQAPADHPSAPAEQATEHENQESEAVTPADSAAAPEPSAEDTSGGIAGGGAAEPAASNNDTFVLKNAGGSAKAAQGASASKLKATKTEALIKFIVVDKEKGPIPGVVIALTKPGGPKFFTGETDAQGYTEVLVPVGQKYDLVYLSLGREDVTANVAVTDEPNQNIKLTLRYKRFSQEEAPRFVLDGVNFDTGKATLKPDSFPRLDSVVEYLKHKPSARIQISGHTDNVGNAKANKALSDKRAQACRDYLISQGIDGARIEAHGYGDERPLADNSTAEGRAQNRRIEATEL